VVPPLTEQRATDLPTDLQIVAEAAGHSYADAVHQLLAIVRTQLGMQVAWVSEFTGVHQVLRFGHHLGRGSCFITNQRFFAQDVCAMLEAKQSLFVVQLRRRRNTNRIWLFVLQHLL